MLHNVGPNRPRLTHSAFVAYLWECSSLWKAQPNGADQAQRVAEAAKHAEENASTCAVCRKDSRL